MYLKELRINGFKSFADPTRFELHPGMTAIVGPNGCGKSNVADAIRWVLGEQSTKSLRAGSMQDVIFQGSTQRKPVNLCEVTLLFTDCERDLGTAYNEVEISRRVTLEGGSDYFLNGKACRLKDVQRLFLDTGVGQVSYSFMLQGQIDKVLSSNPAERRGIFEEAAGISKYKAQRREALNKLAQVENNLARVTDVIEEVSRQIGSLKRQASKALRYKRIKHRLTHLELAVAAHRRQILQDQIAELEERAGGLRERVRTTRARLEAREAELAADRAKRNERSEAMQSAQQTVYDLRSEKEQAENQAEFAGIRAADAEKRIAAIREELESLEQEKQEITGRLAGESRSKEEELNHFGDSDRVFQEKSAELVQVQEALSEAESRLQDRKQDLLVTEGSITRLRSNCTTLEVDLKTYQVRHANLTEDLQNLEVEAESLAERQLELSRTYEARTAERERAAAEAEEHQASVGRLRERFKERQSALQEVDRQNARLTARLGVLEDLQQKFEGFREGAKAILQGNLGNLVSDEECRVLARALKVSDPRWMPALETLLGSMLDAVVLKDRRQVGAVAAALSEQQLGRACLAYATPRSDAGAPDSLPAFLSPAEATVRSDDEGVAELLPGFFEGCYFCESLERFLQFLEGRPDFPFLLVASTEGELVDRRGVVFAGRARGKKDPNFLQRANEIKQLKREQAECAREHDSIKNAADQIQSEIEAAEKRAEQYRARHVEIAQEISTLEAQQESTRAALEQNEQRIRERRAELDKLDSGREESTGRLKKARTELEQCEAEITAGRKAVSEAEAEITRLREDRDQRRERFNEIRLEISEKKQRLAMLDRGLGQLQEQSRELHERTRQREQEIDTLSEQIADFRKQAEEQSKLASEIEETLRTTMQNLEGGRDALKQVERAIQEREESVGRDRAAADRDAQELNEHDVRLARLRSDMDYLLQEISREYDTAVDQIDWKRELWEAGDELPERIRVDIEEESPDPTEEPEPRGEPTEEDLAALEHTDWEAISAEAKSLRGRLNAMGPVNLLAIEEYRELNERYDFLKNQSDDLWNSKERLMKAIDEINQTSQELFHQTFEQIRKNFTFTFETLFGGGDADLRLVDADDVLESGIDITARPPGTRLRNLALLSGGQKTMTAVALLFAIYMVKPSPFCVLDEIDAPLDDANIGRFCDMLKRFLQYSQFVIITHNKRTIGEADSIYGVTMQERGVSKVVAMRFEAATAHAAAAPVAAT